MSKTGSFFGFLGLAREFDREEFPVEYNASGKFEEESSSALLRP